jgi:hypothetical protein
MAGEDEGIVQAVAKATDQLSPRLHHLSFPGPRGPGNADALDVNRYSCHRPHGFYPCLARAGCSARRNPRGRKLVPAHGHRYLGATRNDSGWIGFPIAPSTTMATHPQSHTLPVDVVKSVATLAHEQERLVFLSMPSQHDIAQTDRPISQSFAEALHVALGHKIG